MGDPVRKDEGVTLEAWLGFAQFCFWGIKKELFACFPATQSLLKLRTSVWHQNTGISSHLCCGHSCVWDSQIPSAVVSLHCKSAYPLFCCLDI